MEPRSEGTVENRTDVKRKRDDMTCCEMALHRLDKKSNGTELRRTDLLWKGMALKRDAADLLRKERELH